MRALQMTIRKLRYGGSGVEFGGGEVWKGKEENPITQVQKTRSVMSFNTQKSGHSWYAS